MSNENDIIVNENKNEQNNPNEIVDVIKIDRKVSNDEVLVNVNYLDKEILNVKTFTSKEADSFDQDLNNEDNFDESIYNNNIENIQEKEVVQGTVVGVNDKGVIIDIGFKSEGVIDGSEFKHLPEIGDEVDVFLICFETKKGDMILSKEKADFAKRWDELRNAFSDDNFLNKPLKPLVFTSFLSTNPVKSQFLTGWEIHGNLVN